MNSKVFGMLAETFIHVGSGQADDAVDLPVARESTTHYPFIPGSGFKGALLDKARADGLSQSDRDDLFGQPNFAGQLLIGDVRLLLLPIRSLAGSYRWACCQHLLERLYRDLARAGRQANFDPSKCAVPEGRFIGRPDPARVHLEERVFEHVAEIETISNLLPVLEALIPETVGSRLKNQVVILNNDDFAWFAKQGLPVHARNNLDTETKESKNLWYEECLSPDTVMYTAIGQRSHSAKQEAVQQISKLLDKAYLQTGGNETVGQGWFQVNAIRSLATVGA